MRSFDIQPAQPGDKSRLGNAMRRPWKVATKMLTVEILIIALFIIPAAIYAAATISKSINTNPDLSRGLVGWWTFDSPDLLQNAVDKSGNGHTGRLISMSTTTTQGKLGQALAFDGTDDYVDTGQWSDSLTVITVCAWVKPTSGSRQDYVARWPQQYVLLQGVTASKFQFYTYTGTLTGSAVSDTTIVPGTWYHVCGTHDASNLKLYVNGVKEGADVAQVGNLFSGSAQNNLIGKSDDALTSATIDDVRIYSRALSAAEVERLYEVGATAKVAVTPETGLASPTQADGSGSGLLGHWTFDGPDLLQNAVDSSGNGGTGYLTGFTSTTTVISKLGQALIFDSTDDAVVVPHNANQLLTSGFSFSVWVYPRSAGQASFGNIIDKSTGTAGQGGYELETRVGDIVAVRVNNGTAQTSAAGSVPLNKWTHVVATVDASAVVSFYINGVESGSPAATGALSGITTTNPLTIGNRSGASDRTFDGYLDDVRIYNRVLSAAESERLYEVGATAKIAVTTQPGLADDGGLVGHWTFDGPNLPQNVGDSSGRGNNARLSSGFTSTTTVIGRIGQGLSFDGVDDYADTASLSSGVPGATITATAWVKTSTTDDHDIILNKGSAWYWAIGADGGVAGKPSFWSGAWRVANTAVNDGKWHHVAIVVSGGTVTFYRDGVADGSAASTITDQSNIIRVGRRVDGLNNGDFEGMMDDVRIYNRALTGAEVVRLYQLGL